MNAARASITWTSIASAIFMIWKRLAWRMCCPSPAVVIVEWPERLTLRTDWPVMRIHLEHIAEDTRQITMRDDLGSLEAATG